jgi:6-phosphogluconolactonase (cycloisomerase 2 family)
MFRKMMSLVTFVIVFLGAACLVQPVFAEEDGFPIAGAVYVMSNATSGNSILIFDRFATGDLVAAGEVSTGGLGTGGSLGNQNALVLDPSQRWLFAVNAGSNEISVFAVEENGLTLIQTISSGGVRPVSLTIDRNLLYVLHDGGQLGDTDNITGFTVSEDGTLTPLPNSTRLLSAQATDPAQVQFTPDGRVLVVTEKATNIIDTFIIGPDGLPSDANSQPSAGTTPFGFAFGRRGQLFVSEAASSASGAGTVTSYEVLSTGELQVIDPAEPTTETATCWVVVSNDRRFAYVTNTGSFSITGFRIDFDGNLTRLTGSGRTGDTGVGTTPIDLILSPDGRTLYSLDNTLGTISVFRVRLTGRLNLRQTVTGLPPGANGIAAR